jgi:hypothetical protein
MAAHRLHGVNVVADSGPENLLLSARQEVHHLAE